MKNALLSSIAKSTNRYLRLDPQSTHRLEKLKGQCISVELLPFHYQFQCVFSEAGLQLQSEERVESAAKITGTPLQIVSVALAKQNRHRFFADDLTISGDAALAQEVIELFDELHIDWEEQLSHFIGDVPAYHAGRLAQKMRRWLEKSEKAFEQDITEYVHEEAQWAPPKEALADFYNDIDTLRMDVDRIEARIKNVASMSQSDIEDHPDNSSHIHHQATIKRKDR